MLSHQNVPSDSRNVHNQLLSDDCDKLEDHDNITRDQILTSHFKILKRSSGEHKGATAHMLHLFARAATTHCSKLIFA